MKEGTVFRAAAVQSLPVLSGYVTLGIGFGILSEKAGYGLGWALLMSVAVYAGSMQYVLISLLSGGASVLTTALSTLMVNARHLFYGVAMIDRYKEAGARKPYLIFALTDETYSLVCTGALPNGVAERDRYRYYFTLSLLNQCYWVAGSLIGAALGAALPFDTAGIEFSMTALFVTVFVEQWLTAKRHLPALLGLAAALVCRLVFGAGNFLIPAMLAILGLLLAARPGLEAAHE